ncbi:transketolase [Pseudokineococcus basanitobsidens]|uniref:Transketolase n=1 Tax=Pseudokineococcus basanitobsidens TaxID=1926649 RepID=A0ABU8RLZ7_9ACTN
MSSTTTTDPVITSGSASAPADQREAFYGLLPRLLADDDRLVVVLAAVGAGYLDVPEELAGRVVDVGIREQLLVSTAGGLALTGLRPVVHTFPPFLVERPFEQVKLDLGHQGVGAVLVSAGGSYGWPAGGATHFGPRDVALLDTLDGWTVHAPGHPAEVEPLLRRAVAGDDRVYLRLDPTSNARPADVTDDRWRVVREGGCGLVVAVGPVLDRVLAATEGLDVAVLHAVTVRPVDAAALRAAAHVPEVVLVEPWLRGTSSHLVAEALRDRPLRLLALGVDRAEHRAYGEVADHDRLHGLDVAGLRRSVQGFVAAQR